MIIDQITILFFDLKYKKINKGPIKKNCISFARYQPMPKQLFPLPSGIKLFINNKLVHQ